MSKKIQRNPKQSHKRGDDIGELAIKHRKKTTNFKQSRDIHEDRGTRQTKLGKKKK